MPDNCAVDAQGRLWISTDGNSPAKTGRADGLWAIETEGDARATSKPVLPLPATAPKCAAPTSPPTTRRCSSLSSTPARVTKTTPRRPRATFEAPSTRWPDFQPGMPPRPAVLVVTRKGGGKIAV